MSRIVGKADEEALDTAQRVKRRNKKIVIVVAIIAGIAALAIATPFIVLNVLERVSPERSYDETIEQARKSIGFDEIICSCRIQTGGTVFGDHFTHPSGGYALICEKDGEEIVVITSMRKSVKPQVVEFPFDYNFTDITGKINAAGVECNLQGAKDDSFRFIDSPATVEIIGEYYEISDLSERIDNGVVIEYDQDYHITQENGELKMYNKDGDGNITVVDL